MDQRIAPWFFLGGILLMILGIYETRFSVPNPEAELLNPLFRKEVSLQLAGILCAIFGFFGLLHGPEPGEEF